MRIFEKLSLKFVMQNIPIFFYVYILSNIKGPYTVVFSDQVQQKRTPQPLLAMQ